MVITVGLQIKLLQMYPSFQGAISQNHILHLILHEFSALFALKQRKGLLMFSLSFLFYSFPLRTPLGERKDTVRDSPMDTDHHVPEVSAFELEVVLIVFSSQYSSSGILPLEYDHLNFRQALTFLEECQICRRSGTIRSTSQLLGYFCS